MSQYIEKGHRSYFSKGKACGIISTVFTHKITKYDTYEEYEKRNEDTSFKKMNKR